MELKSKTIPDKLMEGLVTVCDKEVDRHLGEKQVRGNYSSVSSDLMGLK